jgi:hypothetical protein
MGHRTAQQLGVRDVGREHVSGIYGLTGDFGLRVFARHRVVHHAEAEWVAVYAGVFSA